MNIVFCIPDLGCGGAERVVSKLANDWVSGNRIAIITLTPASSDFYQFDPRIERICIERKKKKWYSLSSQAAMIYGFRKNFDRLRPDYIVSFLPKTNILVLLSTLFSKHKVVACERNIINDPSIDWRQHVLRRLLYPRAYKITVQHQEIFDEFVAAYPAIPKEKIAITPNPVNPFSGAAAADPRELFPDFPSEGFLLMAVGRFTSVKAFPDMIRMFALAVRENPQLRLAIFGEGSLYGECAGLAADLGLDGRIAMPGATDRIDSWYAAADVFVTTTRFEGFPNALTEALAAGLPAVAFRAPSIGVFVADDYNGILVEERNIETMADAIALLSKDQDRVRRYSEAAKTVSDAYSPERMSALWFERVLC